MPLTGCLQYGGTLSPSQRRAVGLQLPTTGLNQEALAPWTVDTRSVPAFPQYEAM
jgi:hypothetical protein